MGRKNKNGRPKPHVNKYINQKGKLLKKRMLPRKERSTLKAEAEIVAETTASVPQSVRRFEIWFAELGNHYGSSVQSGSRPVLVMSNDVANHYSSTLTVIPMTTVMKKLELPTHIPVSEADCQMYGSHTYLRESIALAEQVTTIDKKALRNVLCRVTSAEKQKEIEQALAGFFNMVANPPAPDTATNEEARTW